METMAQMKHAKIFCLVIVFTVLAYPVFSEGNDPENDRITVLSPGEDETVYEKKPVIRFEIKGPVVPGTLYVELDYADVTVLVKQTDTGFEFRPVQVLPSGDHTLVIRFTGEDQQDHFRELRFSTRQSEYFETVYSRNQISAQYQHVLDKSGNVREQTMSDWQTSANLNTQNLAARGPWEVSFTSNARYMDQELPMAPPTEKGLELVDYRFDTKYQQENYTAGISLGDISVSGTRNTYNGLARRGGVFSLDYGPLALSAFSVRSDQSYGLDGKWGLELENDNHLHGGAGTLSFLDDRMEVTVAHISGGEITGNSYGIWSSTPGGTRGKATGVRVKTDFFEQKAQTVLEFDQSGHDDDITDGVDLVSDNAFYGEVSGFIDRFGYQASYEHSGPDYKVPGNSGTTSDREGATLSTSYAFDVQSVSLRFSQFNNNVDDNPAYARVTSRDFGIDYSLSKFPSVPVSLGWYRSIQSSANEPSPWEVVDNSTTTWSGNISYMKDKWSIGFGPVYSRQDDKTPENFDSDSFSATVYSTYSAEKYSLSGSAMYNQSRDFRSDVDTETYSYSLSFSCRIIDNLTVDGSAGFNQMQTSDDMVDQDFMNGDLQLTWRLERPLWGILSPKIFLKGTYGGSRDHLFGTDSDGTLIYLMLTGDLELSF
jgi:hypothetical protein